MITLKSRTEEGKKYFFEGFGFRKESIEGGRAHPVAKGKLVSSLEVSLDSNDYVLNDDLKRILMDCCPPSFIEGQGVKATISYIKAFGWSDTHKTMYVHTIQEE